MSTTVTLACPRISSFRAMPVHTRTAHTNARTHTDTHTHARTYAHARTHTHAQTAGTHAHILMPSSEDREPLLYCWSKNTCFHENKGQLFQLSFSAPKKHLLSYNDGQYWVILQTWLSRRHRPCQTPSIGLRHPSFGAGKRCSECEA